MPLKGQKSHKNYAITIIQDIVYVYSAH